MELQVNGNVNVTVELGPQTLALLTGGMAAPAPSVKPGGQTVKEILQSDRPLTTEDNATLIAEKKKINESLESKKNEAPKAPAKPKKDEPTPFEEMGDEAKLEEIKALVTKGTKKGKSSDIKFLLSNFEAGRASELSPDQYDDFHAAILRYYDGEAVTDIFPGEEEEDLG